ncbi:MAG: DUF2799 domain-containing protein [Oricola sp.]
MTAYPRKSILLAAIAVLALSGCQTLNKDQCSVTDWRTLGSTDGASGRPQNYVARHQEACTKFGIPVDIPAWQSGWQEGIRNFCTPANGLDIGMRGSGYDNSCPADQAIPFREAYDTGYRVYSARSERDRIQGELDTAIAELAGVKEEDRTVRQIQIELKRSELFAAQNRLNDAERAVDFYRLRMSTAR